MGRALKASEFQVSRAFQAGELGDTKQLYQIDVGILFELHIIMPPALQFPSLIGKGYLGSSPDPNWWR